MSEDILEARAKVKKIRSQPKTQLRRRWLRKAEENLAKLRHGLEEGAKEVKHYFSTGPRARRMFYYAYYIPSWGFVPRCQRSSTIFWTPA